MCRCHEQSWHGLGRGLQQNSAIIYAPLKAHDDRELGHYQVTENFPASIDVQCSFNAARRRAK
jgi:hypothetical protein